MAVLEQEKWLAELYEFNPWWKTGEVPEEKLSQYRRPQYYSCHRLFHHRLRRIVVLSGARRVGKTTIVYQIIDDLLRNGTPPMDILFFTFDTATMRDVGMEEILRWYRMNLSESKNFYLFIDEIQRYQDWSDYVKLLYDRFPGMRCIVTGSASSRIEGALQESGAGRWVIQKVPTLSFYEFCSFNGEEKSVEALPVFEMHTLSVPKQRQIYLQLSDLHYLLMKYLQQGGFPEFAAEEDLPTVKSYLYDQVLNRTIRQDIPAIHEVRDIDGMERVFLYTCVHSSEIISIETIGREMTGISNATIRDYLRYFEEANLIYRSEQLDISGKKMLKPKNKIYLTDSGIRWAIVPGSDIYTKETELGFALETMVYKHIREYYDALTERYRIGYLQDSRGNEIDMVIQDPVRDEPLQYVEAKMRNRSGIRDKDGIAAYGMKERPGYVITKTPDDFGLSERTNTELYRIPAAAFLYQMGMMLDGIYRDTGHSMI